jgi:hypothetical protein
MALCSQLQLGLAHRTIRWCTGQCPVRQAGPREKAALGTRRRRTTIIHQTVQWCTVLSGESSVANSSPSGKARGDVAIIHRIVRWCTGLSGEPTVVCANGRPCNLHATCGLLQRSAGTPDSVRCANHPRGATIGYAKFGRRSSTGPSTGHIWWRTGLSGAPLDRRQG